MQLCFHLPIALPSLGRLLLINDTFDSCLCLWLAPGSSQSVHLSWSSARICRSEAHPQLRRHHLALLYTAGSVCLTDQVAWDRVRGEQRSGKRLGNKNSEAHVAQHEGPYLVKTLSQRKAGASCESSETLSWMMSGAAAGTRIGLLRTGPDDKDRQLV